MPRCQKRHAFGRQKTVLLRLLLKIITRKCETRRWFAGINYKYELHFILFKLLFSTSNFDRLINNFSLLMDHLFEACRNFCINISAIILMPLPIRNLLLLPAKQLEGSQTKPQDLGFSWTNINCTTGEADYHSQSPNLSWTKRCQYCPLNPSKS